MTCLCDKVPSSLRRSVQGAEAGYVPCDKVSLVRKCLGRGSWIYPCDKVSLGTEAGFAGAEARQ